MISSVKPISSSVSPTMTRAASDASGTPIAFDTNGIVRLARGFTSSTYTTPSLIAYCTLISPTTPSAFASATVCSRIVCMSRLADEIRRQHARRVAGVDAGVLDVLHDAADHDARAVGDRVDVALERVLEEAVDEHGPLFRHARRRREVLLERRRIVHDLHRASAEHVRRPHEHRDSRSRSAASSASSTLVAVPFGGCSSPSSRAIFSKRRRSSAMSIASGDVPRIGTPAASRSRVSLSGVCPPSCTITPSGCSRCDDLEHVLERERLEVQLVRGVEVGRDGLRIRVDHDRLESALRAARSPRARSSSRTRRPARFDSARCRGSRPSAARCAALRSPRRSCRRDTASPTETRRRRCRPSCTPAARPSAQRRSRTRRFGLAAQRAELAIGEAHALHAAQVVRVDLVERRVLALGLDQLPHLVEEPRIDRRELVHLVDAQPALERALHLEDALRRRLAQRAAQRLDRVVGQPIVDAAAPRSSTRSGPSPARAAPSETLP